MVAVEEVAEVTSAPIRIAFVGLHNAGKTFAAHYLYIHHNFKTMKLMDGTAKVVKWFYKYRHHQRVKWEQRVTFYDALYKIDNDIHVDYLIRKLDGGQPTTRDVVVDDARYANEVIKLKAAGFTIIRMTMENEKLKRIVSNKETSPNRVSINERFSSKANVYPVDYSILNVNTEGLYRMLDNIIEKERNKRKIAE